MVSVDSFRAASRRALPIGDLSQPWSPRSKLPIAVQMSVPTPTSVLLASTGNASETSAVLAGKLDVHFHFCARPRHASADAAADAAAETVGGHPIASARGRRFEYGASDDQLEIILLGEELLCGQRQLRPLWQVQQHGLNACR